MADPKRKSRKLPRRRRPAAADLSVSQTASSPQSENVKSDNVKSDGNGVLRDLITIIGETAEQRSGVNDAAVRACIRALWTFGTTKHEDSRELCLRIEERKRSSNWSDEAFRKALGELREVSDQFAGNEAAENPLLQYLSLLRQS